LEHRRSKSPKDTDAGNFTFPFLYFFFLKNIIQFVVEKTWEGYRAREESKFVSFTP